VLHAVIGVRGRCEPETLLRPFRRFGGSGAGSATVSAVCWRTAARTGRSKRRNRSTSASSPSRLIAVVPASNRAGSSQSAGPSNRAEAVAMAVAHAGSASDRIHRSLNYNDPDASSRWVTFAVVDDWTWDQINDGELYDTSEETALAGWAETRRPSRVSWCTAVRPRRGRGVCTSSSRPTVILTSTTRTWRLASRLPTGKGLRTEARAATPEGSTSRRLCRAQAGVVQCFLAVARSPRGRRRVHRRS
jgi:hypothetical protein